MDLGKVQRENWTADRRVRDQRALVVEQLGCILCSANRNPDKARHQHRYKTAIDSHETLLGKQAG
jgi:hypothetical protein